MTCGKSKVVAILSAVSSIVALSATVGAEGEVTTATAAVPTLSNYSGQITSQFTQAASDIAPIIIGVLGAGITIFVIFIGIKYGKKMFSTVSK